MANLFRKILKKFFKPSEEVADMQERLRLGRMHIEKNVKEIDFLEDFLTRYSDDEMKMIRQAISKALDKL
jgi:hypothetical protein